MNIFTRISRSVKVRRINRALGIKLVEYQIAHIFDGEPFPEPVQRSRCSEKTTAQILFVLLHRFDNRACPLLRVDDIQCWDGLRDITPESVAAERAYLFDEDGVTRIRREMFMKELLECKRKLKKHRIKTNAVCVVYQGKRHTIL